MLQVVSVPAISRNVRSASRVVRRRGPLGKPTRGQPIPGATAEVAGQQRTPCSRARWRRCRAIRMNDAPWPAHGLGGHGWPGLAHLIGQDEGFELQAVGLRVPAFAVQRGPVQDVGQFVDSVRQHDAFPVLRMHIGLHRQIVQDQTWPPASPTGDEHPQIQVKTRAGVGFAAFRCPYSAEISDWRRMYNSWPARSRHAITRHSWPAGRPVGRSHSSSKYSRSRSLQPTPFGQRDEDDFLAVVAAHDDRIPRPGDLADREAQVVPQIVIWAVNSCMAQGLVASGDKKLYKKESLQYPATVPSGISKRPPGGGGTERRGFIMDKPNFYISEQTYNSLIGPGYWSIQDLPDSRAQQVRPFLASKDTIGVFASGVAPTASEMRGPIGGIDWVRLESNRMKGEPPLNVYHFVIREHDGQGYPVYACKSGESIAPHWSDWKDIQCYFSSKKHDGKGQCSLEGLAPEPSWWDLVVRWSEGDRWIEIGFTVFAVIRLHGEGLVSTANASSQIFSNLEVDSQHDPCLLDA